MDECEPRTTGSVNSPAIDATEDAGSRRPARSSDTRFILKRALSPRALEIVAAARTLLEEEGPDALSMRRIAHRLGIKASSIYKHLPDKQACENALISAGFEEQAVLFESVVEEADDPVTALATAYRDWAHRHRHLYRLMTERTLDRDNLIPGAENRAALPLLEAFRGDIDLARAAWAFAHGMTILELDQRFPSNADLDAAWAVGIAALRSRRASAA